MAPETIADLGWLANPVDRPAAG